jgi:hypothetical protein
LKIVEISGGATAEFEPSRKRFEKWQLFHPVLWDEKNCNAKAYGIPSWPSAFLIGRDGKVFWQGNPNEATRTRPDEAAFRSLLEDHLRRERPAGK